MTQLNLIVNSLPRDLSEFAFFLIVGFTAGSIGLSVFCIKLLIEKIFIDESLPFYLFSPSKILKTMNKNS